MNDKLKKNLIQEFRNSIEPIFSGTIAEWAKEFISLSPAFSIQGSFDISLSNYLKPIFLDLRNPDINQINLIAATQTGKTLCSEIFIPFIILHSPGPALKLHQSDEMADQFTETRLIPILENCKPVKSILTNTKNRFAATKKGIILPHMSVKIAAAKENVLHGMSIRYLLLDEVWLYTDPQAVEKAKARTTAFGNNKKILLTSQPGLENDLLDRENTGLVYEWGWRCRECNNLQPWYWSKEKEDGTWAGITWTKHYSNETSSSYDFQKTGDSAKLNCYYCSASYTEKDRKYLNDTGEYIQIADHGDHKVKTYTWCAFVNPKITFKEKCIQYIQAKLDNKKFGTTDAIKLFNQQVLGKPWKPSVAMDQGKILVNTFNKDEQWADQIFKCLSVDYQQKHSMKFYAVVAFSRSEIRIVDHGYVAKWDEIHKIAELHKLPPPAVGIDSGFQASEVYLEAVNHGKIIKLGKHIERVGWTCLKGADKDDGWPHIGPNREKIVKYYSPMVRAAVSNNQYARLFHWSNFAIKTILYNIREGKSDMKLVLPTPDPDFTQQLNAETLQEVLDPKTGLRKNRWVKISDNNHYLDVLCQAITLCMMASRFGQEPTPPPPIVVMPTNNA